MSLIIRDATNGDAAIIADFNDRMCQETEGESLEPGLIGPGVKRLLADTANGRYWLGEIDDRVVGQIMVTYEWSDWRDGRIWWIQSVYVHADYRRQGIFRALYRHVESLAMEDRDACGLRLYVDRDNQRAKRTYDSLGMIETRYRIMEAMFDRDK